MTTDPAWSVTARALDHHDTVLALTEAMPDGAADVPGKTFKQSLAEGQAAGLARAGLVLMPMNGAAPVTASEQLEAAIREEAARSWFGRDEED